MTETIRMTRWAAGGGCGCKLPPAALRDILARVGNGGGDGVGVPAPAGLLVDGRDADDAAVWQVAEDCAILATADFFPPVADVPFDYGRIAAANALSDLYAMGGTPLFALALVGMPAKLPGAAVAEVLRGGAAACAEAGIVVAGGHSIAAAEPLYGLAAIGRAHPARIMTNGGARAGDVLILGKPLGVGALAAALQKDRLSAAGYAQMLQWTTRLNKAGPELAALPGARALTDVTGFGLLGHLLEMCRAAKLAAEVAFDKLPLLPEAVALMKDGVAAGAAQRNWDSYGAEVTLPPGIAPWQKTMLTDPQTSGGLLLSCGTDAADAALEIFRRHGCGEAAVIGRMKEAGADGAQVAVRIGQRAVEEGRPDGRPGDGGRARPLLNEGGAMEAKRLEALTESCRAAAGRASADAVTAGDLAMLRDADGCARKLSGAGRAGAGELRAAVDEVVAVLERRPGGRIHSRLDSHHWDLGFLRVESGFDVVAVVDGDVLCWNEDEEKELHLIGRDEVRVDFGDGVPD